VKAVKKLLLALTVLAVFILSTVAPAIPVAHAEEPYQGPTPEYGDKAVEAVKAVLESGKVSQETQTCITCHLQFTPGIVYQWAQSAHAQHPAKDAAEIYKAIGAEEWIDKISPKFKNYDKVVGCYECHGMYADQDRPDVVEHFGFKIVTVVTRKDCGQCHPKEDAEISWTWHAMGSLHAPFTPWYKGIVTYAAKKLGANPFGNAEQKKLYEEYFPPYLTKQRDKEPVYWDFYKKIAKAIYDYLNGKMTPEDEKIINMLKEATGMITPYDMDFKTWISPLWPASGVLNTTVLYRDNISLTVTAAGKITAGVSNPMSHPAFRNAYIYHACGECHGTVVLPYKVDTIEGATVMRYWGWPSNGAARVDPDGSIGTCTACHPRHQFSIKQARKPWTCGQCHLGYDHPHIEIYEESKHGNIENAYGEHWNWERLPWRVGVDFNAPTCATCHMSTISVVDPTTGKETIVVKGTHDFLNRIVWNEMHFFAAPKPIIPDKIQESLFLHYSVLKGDMAAVMKAHEQLAKEGAPVKWPVFMGIEISEGYKPGETGLPRMLNIKFTGELAEHRQEMMKVCELCHSVQWIENYFRTADQNMIDYDVVAHFANALLKLAWQLGIQDKRNIIDEYMEIMWYYIWHHDGRRWRNGAFMMGPDYAHWYGIVDTVMDKLGRMIEYFDIALKVKMLKTELAALKAQAKGAPYQPALAAKIAELEQQLAVLRQKLEAMEAQVPTMLSTLEKLETDFNTVLESMQQLQQTSSKTAEEIASMKTDLSKALEQIQQLKQLAAQLPAPQKQQIQKMLADIEQTLKKLEELSSQVSSAKSAAASASEAAKTTGEQVAELSKKVDELKDSIEGMARSAMVVGVIAIVLALVAAALALYRRK
jgi:predicted nuclease with TOPRIM domain